VSINTQAKQNVNEYDDGNCPMIQIDLKNNCFHPCEPIPIDLQNQHYLNIRKSKLNKIMEAAGENVVGCQGENGVCTLVSTIALNHPKLLLKSRICKDKRQRSSQNN
jgi:hypothetical protein